LRCAYIPTIWSCSWPQNLGSAFRKTGRLTDPSRLEQQYGLNSTTQFLAKPSPTPEIIYIPGEFSPERALGIPKLAPWGASQRQISFSSPRRQGDGLARPTKDQHPCHQRQRPFCGPRPCDANWELINLESPQKKDTRKCLTASRSVC